MSTELVQECPRCGGERAFYRTASTTLHLGVKTKWRCPDCEFGLVRVDGEIDSAPA